MSAFRAAGDAELIVGRPAALAGQLVAGGARVVVVGGRAHWLRSGRGMPRDLDVVVEERDLPGLVSALGRLGVWTTVASLLRSRQVRLDTSWGPLDVFVSLAPAHQQVQLESVSVLVSVAT